MGFLRFLFTKTFLKQLALAIVISILLVFIILMVFRSYTKHGSYITVPDFSGKTFAEVDTREYNRDFKFIIMDSVYNAMEKKGSIIHQNPAPNSAVKKGRKIYLTVIAMQTEKVGVPNVTDLSLRQAISVLQINGLVPGNLQYIPDFARNAVLEQKYKGKRVQPGTMIEKGSEIDLVVGLGEESTMTALPLFVGQKVIDARMNVRKASLNLKKEVFEDEEDVQNCRVYKQSPKWSRGREVGFGTEITLWYKSESNFDFKKHLQGITKDSTLYLPYF